MEARECPSCDCLYRPRHARESERCWSCSGLSFGEHVAAIEDASGNPRRKGHAADRSNGQPGANERAAYLKEIDVLLGS